MTRVNGVTMQDSNTDDLIFDVPTLVHELSKVMTLDPGDIIITGTPSGVAMARKPQNWLKPGDVCEVEIERHRHAAQHDRPGRLALSGTSVRNQRRLRKGPPFLSRMSRFLALVGTFYNSRSADLLSCRMNFHGSGEAQSGHEQR